MDSSTVCQVHQYLGTENEKCFYSFTVESACHNNVEMYNFFVVPSCS